MYFLKNELSFANEYTNQLAHLFPIIVCRCLVVNGCVSCGVKRQLIIDRETNRFLLREHPVAGKFESGGALISYAGLKLGREGFVVAICRRLLSELSLPVGAARPGCRTLLCF